MMMRSPRRSDCTAAFKRSLFVWQKLNVLVRTQEDEQFIAIFVFRVLAGIFVGNKKWPVKRFISYDHRVTKAYLLLEYFGHFRKQLQGVFQIDSMTFSMRSTI